jgi:uncharacterized protein (TIGR02145 family)
MVGAQEWTAKNLDIVTYRNGDIIPQVTASTVWTGLTTGAWCYPNNNATSGATYGKLYNRYVVTDPRGFGPDGFVIPDIYDYNLLYITINNDGGSLKQTGTTYWNSPNSGATDLYGFRSLPSGYKAYNGNFGGTRIQSHFWLSGSSAQIVSLYYNKSNISTDSSISSVWGFPIRMLKRPLVPPVQPQAYTIFMSYSAIT